MNPNEVSWLASVMKMAGDFIDRFGWPGLFTLAFFGIAYWYVVRPCAPLLPAVLSGHLTFLDASVKTMKARRRTGKRLTDTAVAIEASVSEMRRKHSEVVKGAGKLIDAGVGALDALHDNNVDLESESLKPHVARARDRLRGAWEHFRN